MWVVVPRITALLFFYKNKKTMSDFHSRLDAAFGSLAAAPALTSSTAPLSPVRDTEPPQELAPRDRPKAAPTSQRSGRGSVEWSGRGQGGQAGKSGRWEKRPREEGRVGPRASEVVHQGRERLTGVGKGKGGKGRGARTCYRCGGQEHLVRDCPQVTCTCAVLEAA